MTASSAAPPSTLSGVFNHDDRRRYTGGTLQRARPDDRMSVSLDSEKGDSDGDRTPPAKEPPAGPTSTGQEISASLIDPALHSSGSPSSSPSSADADATLRTAQAATEVAERADSQWVSLVRALEGLRGWINYRIDNQDYESEEEQQQQQQQLEEQEMHSREQPAEQQHNPTPEQAELQEQPEAPSEDVTMGGMETGAEKAAVKTEGPGETGEDTVMYPTLRGLDEDGDSKMPSS